MTRATIISPHKYNETKNALKKDKSNTDDETHMMMKASLGNVSKCAKQQANY